MIDPTTLPPQGATIPPRFSFESNVPLLPRDEDIHPDSPRPDLPRPALMEMREAAELPDDLMGGTRAMRANHGKWLGQELAEKPHNYDLRVKRSTCFPFYKDTLCDLAARPFGRDITWDQEAPELLGEFLRDMDGTGKSMTVFAKDTLLFGMHRGMDHCLVDASSGSGDSAERTDLRRVYAHRIDALSLLDVRDKVDDSGRKRGVCCRFVKPVAQEADKVQRESEAAIVELTKEIGATPGTRVEWKFDKGAKKWVAGPAQEYNPGKKGVPLFTVFMEQTGPYRAAPVLEDLAWVNLAHFQSRSDHAHVMRVARLITLVTLGFDDDEDSPDPNRKKKPIVLGPLARINSKRGPQEASVAFLEPQGKSIELSFDDMEQLGDECKRLGARHLASKTGNITARAVATDDQKATNNLQAFCLRIEVYLRQILDAGADWRNVPLPETVQPHIWKEFSTAINPEIGSRALRDVTDVLSKKQKLIEAKRYGILRPDFPVDENLAELKQEQEDALDAAIAAAAGTPGGNDPTPPDDNTDKQGDDAGEDDAA